MQYYNIFIYITYIKLTIASYYYTHCSNTVHTQGQGAGVMLYSACYKTLKPNMVCLFVCLFVFFVCFFYRYCIYYIVYAIIWHL